MVSVRQDRIRIRSVVPQFGSRTDIPSCVISIAEKMDPTRFDVQAWVWGADEASRDSPTIRIALPSLAYRIMGRLKLEGAIHSTLKRRFLNSLSEGDIAWIWPGFGEDTMQEAKRRGAIVVLERINSSVANSRRILNEAEERLGLVTGHENTPEKIEIEARELELADYVFTCSPFVEESFVSRGLKPERILRATYGWDSERFVVKPRPSGEPKEPIFLFVGSGILRKGLPDLLACWDKAQVPGRLRIIGPIDPMIEEKYANVLARSDVEAIGPQSDLEHFYGDADVFVLPSLEEGSPLVTYLALAAGLPCLVSFAGAGGIVRDNVEGLIREANDSQGLSDALVELAKDSDLRKRLGENAKKASEKYTWTQVARARAPMFERVVQNV